MRQSALAEAYANCERQAMAQGPGLGERHEREWLASEPRKVNACAVAHEQALKYARVNFCSGRRRS